MGPSGIISSEMVGSTDSLPITSRSRSAYIFHPNRDPKPGLALLLLGFAPTERTLRAVPSRRLAPVADPGDRATFSVFWLTSSPFHSLSGSVSVLGPEMPCLCPFFSCLIVLKISFVFRLLLLFWLLFIENDAWDVLYIFAFILWPIYADAIKSVCMPSKVRIFLDVFHFICYIGTLHRLMP